MSGKTGSAVGAHTPIVYYLDSACVVTRAQHALLKRATRFRVDGVDVIGHEIVTARSLQKRNYGALKYVPSLGYVFTIADKVIPR